MEPHVYGQPDLSQCPWYHGPTTRIASEMSLVRDMDFLVRDCISSPGDYVLTTRWRGQGGTIMDRKSQPVKIKNIPATDSYMCNSKENHELTFVYPMVLFPGMTDAPLSDEPYYGIRRGSRCCSGERDGLPANVPVRGRGVRHRARVGTPPRHETGEGRGII